MTIAVLTQPLCSRSSARITVDPRTVLTDRALGAFGKVLYNADDDLDDPYSFSLSDVLVLSRERDTRETNRLEFLEHICTERREFRLLGVRAWIEFKKLRRQEIKPLLQLPEDKHRTLRFGAIVEKPAMIGMPEIFLRRKNGCLDWQYDSVIFPLKSRDGLLAVWR